MALLSGVESFEPESETETDGAGEEEAEFISDLWGLRCCILRGAEPVVCLTCDENCFSKSVTSSSASSDAEEKSFSFEEDIVQLEDATGVGEKLKKEDVDCRNAYAPHDLCTLSVAQRSIIELQTQILIVDM